MTWQQILIGYIAVGVATLVLLTAVRRVIDSKTPEARIQGLLEGFRHEQEPRGSPGLKSRLKNDSADIVARVLAAAFVVVAWPVAIGLRVNSWLSKRTDSGG